MVKLAIGLSAFFENYAISYKDHFSGHAGDYAAFRPTYPKSLYVWLAGQTHTQEMAWDCACGNGQAALGLATHFDRVIATDASAQQIQAAKRHSSVSYKKALAEESGLDEASMDLVVVAQAVHWFDHAPFFKEVHRVLKEKGILAVWAYELLSLGNQLLEDTLNSFFSEVVGPYWPPERCLVENRYRDLPFPFEEIHAPVFEMQQSWTLERLISYVSTWSATKRYVAATDDDPLIKLRQQMAKHWGDPKAARSITWPLILKVGRKQS